MVSQASIDLFEAGWQVPPLFSWPTRKTHYSTNGQVVVKNVFTKSRHHLKYLQNYIVFSRICYNLSKELGFKEHYLETNLSACLDKRE